MNALVLTYNPLQYPLLFLENDNGWIDIIQQIAKNHKVSIQAFHVYKLHIWQR